MARVFLKEHVWPNPPGRIVEMDEARAQDLVARGVAESVPEEEPGTESTEQPGEQTGTPLTVSDETLHRLAEERGLVLAPEDAVIRIAEILGADEETGLLAAAELWADARDEQEKDLAQAKADVVRLTGEIEVLKSAPAPQYGESEFTAYAEAHNLRFDTSENFAALLAQAHAPITEEEFKAYALEKGLTALTAEELAETTKPAGPVESTVAPAVADPKTEKPHGAKTAK